ncbi:MAG: enoyl-CoA hydratase/isomerase family protein [Alphaproteobacteria bacterium]|nr:enoyl-CoA hydratase/isomerase family protein [Alphaproteobacteria bacterium]
MIDLAKDGARWTVTLNRPDKANALSLEMLERLDQVFAEAALARGLRVLVVTGAGDRVFCAGADLGQAKDATDITIHPIWESVSGRLAGLPCLTIAALNGTLAGGGFGVALACDLRIAVPHARFFYPVLANGFLPQPSDIGRMNALIGPARTKLILLGGQKLTAIEALSIGLIDRIVSWNETSTMLSQLSEAALTADPATLVAIKRLIQTAPALDVLADCRGAVYEQSNAALERLLNNRNV